MIAVEGDHIGMEQLVESYAIEAGASAQILASSFISNAEHGGRKEK